MIIGASKRYIRAMPMLILHVHRWVARRLSLRHVGTLLPLAGYLMLMRSLRVHHRWLRRGHGFI